MDNAPTPAKPFSLPQGFSTLAEAGGFLEAMRHAGPDLERLHAIASCMLLAAALEDHPIADRMQLINDVSGDRKACMSIEIKLPDGEFMDIPSVAHLLWDFREAAKNGGRYEYDGVPELSERLGKLLPRADPDEMRLACDACENQLFAALEPLLLRAPTHAKKAVALAKHGASDSWIVSGATARDVAIGLGLPEIAASIEAFEIQSGVASGLGANRTASL